VKREIQLDGGEITILKALGLSGTPIYGKLLLDKVKEMAKGELIDTLTGMLSMGYILSSKVNILKLEDVEHSSFRINPSYSRDLRSALRPGSRSHNDDRGRRRRRG
jgi:hypothetical protein